MLLQVIHGLLWINTEHFAIINEIDSIDGALTALPIVNGCSCCPKSIGYILLGHTFQFALMSKPTPNLGIHIIIFHIVTYPLTMSL